MSRERNIRGMAVAGVVALIGVAGQARASETLVGVTTTGVVMTFQSNNPGTALTSATITGLNAGDSIQGIDFRPATGTFVAVGQTNQLYTLNVTTGAATPIGAGFTPALDGSPFTRYGIDINPTVDRVRVVGSGAQNRRLNPNDGSAIVGDTALSYNPPIGLGLAPRAVGVAYTNSVAGAPAGSTREYILDSLNNVLGEVGSQAGGNASFNGGIIASTFAVRIGSGIVDFDDNAGFDISGSSGVAYASLGLQASAPGTPTGIYTIDLATGQATFLGTVGSGINLRDLTVVPAPMSSGLLLMAGGAVLRRRRAM